MAVRWQGMAVGFLALTLFEVVVSNGAASSKVGGLATGAGTVAQRLLSPTVPAFGSTPTASSSSSSSSTPAVPPGATAALNNGAAVLASVPLASSPIALN